MPSAPATWTWLVPLDGCFSIGAAFVGSSPLSVGSQAQSAADRVLRRCVTHGDRVDRVRIRDKTFGRRFSRGCGEVFEARGRRDLPEVQTLLGPDEEGVRRALDGQRSCAGRLESQSALRDNPDCADPGRVVMIKE